jgi:hypothetical protein
LNADPGEPIEGRDADPKVLLDFRSASDVVTYQPDPCHLREFVADLEGFRQGATRKQVPRDLICLVVQAIIDGFRRLDALPREHPFWNQTNRRPTRGKLREFCDHLLRENPGDVSALRTGVALEIFTFQNFDPNYWMQLHSLGQLRVSWPIWATVLSGTDAFQSRNLLWFLKVTGLCTEAETTLGELMRSQDPTTSQWAKGIMDGCGERSEGG